MDMVVPNSPTIGAVSNTDKKSDFEHVHADPITVTVSSFLQWITTERTFTQSRAYIYCLSDLILIFQKSDSFLC